MSGQLHPMFDPSVWSRECAEEAVEQDLTEQTTLERQVDVLVDQMLDLRHLMEQQQAALAHLIRIIAGEPAREETS